MNQNTTSPQTDWQFSGFAFPTTTPVPDQLFDELLHRLSGAELKVLLYIVRRTYGFKKHSDDISLGQLVNGIKSKDGKVLDQGTGLGKSSVTRALNSLEDKNIIVRSRRQNDRQGYQATTYTLNILTPLSQNETRGVPPAGQGLSHQRDIQQTVKQQTVRQQHRKTGKDISSGGDGKQNLAAALMDKGIGEEVARQFASQYNQQRIEDNIDWFEWKLKTDPTSIKSNPAGLLRRAIEDNYASEGHHQGFQTRHQKAAATVQQKQRLQQQQKLATQRKQQQQASAQQKETERAKQLETLREQYHSTTKERSLWFQVLSRLKRQMSAVSFNTYLAQSDLLSLQNGQAVIAVPNRFIKTWLEERLADTIQQTLADHSNGQNIRLHFRSLETGQTEYQTSSTGDNKSPPTGS